MTTIIDIVLLGAAALLVASALVWWLLARFAEPGMFLPRTLESDFGPDYGPARRNQQANVELNDPILPGKTTIKLG